MSFEYIMGFVLGAVVVVMLALVVRFVFLRSYGKGKYDERQIALQGQAYKSAFFALIIYLTAYAVLDALGLRWCETATGLFLGILLGVGVFAVRCVFSDAYFKTSDGRKSYLWILTGVGLLNLAIGCRHMVVDRDFVENGLLTFHSVNFFVGVLLLVIVAAAIVKRAMDRRQEEE